MLDLVPLDPLRMPMPIAVEKGQKFYGGKTNGREGKSHQEIETDEI